MLLMLLLLRLLLLLLMELLLRPAERVHDHLTCPGRAR